MMTSLTRYTPMLLNDVIDTFATTLGTFDIDDVKCANSNYVMYRDDEQNLHIDVALPGIKRERVNVNFLPEKRELRVELSADDETNAFNAFIANNYAWRLPDDIDVDAIKASMHDGILSINIPTRKEVVKQIEVLAAT